jgi:hypothetical protein
MIRQGMYFGSWIGRLQSSTLQDNKVSSSQGGTMRHFRYLLFAVIVLGIALPLLAQHGGKSAGTPPATPSSNGSSTTNTDGTAAGSHREPCWKVAGISPSALQQRRSVEQSAKAQIAAVCADSSLTAKQRQQQIQQIHQQTMQAVEALITPQQQEALKACRAARETGTAAAPHPQGAATGPCGEAPAAAETAPSASTHKFN